MTPGQVAADRIELARLFPVFVAPRDTTTPRRALKIGIALDIAARTGWPIERCQAVMEDYTDGPRYLRAVMHGDGIRYDLDGAPAGEVTNGQRMWASKRLKEREAEFTRENKLRRKARRRHADAAAPATA